MAGGAQDALARHALAVVREVVLALTGVALADLVYVAVLAVGRTLYNHIQHDTFNPSSLINASVKHFYRTQLSYLPPANEVWGKVIFLHLFVILFTGRGST